MMAPILICVVALAAMIAMTQPLEVREGRWWKIVEMILHNPATTPEQLQRATAAKVECLNELNGRGLKPK